MRILGEWDKNWKESKCLKENLVSAAEDVGKEGNLMHRLWENLWMTPFFCDVWQCGSGSPALLSAVTWLLVLADMAGFYKLLVQLKVVEMAS